MRTFKVYKNGKIFNITGVKAFSESLARTITRLSDWKKTWRTCLAALDSSRQKIQNYLTSGKLPRTKTSFLGTGLYLFDGSIEDDIIKSYMQSMENYN